MNCDNHAWSSLLCSLASEVETDDHLGIRPMGGGGAELASLASTLVTELYMN